MIAQHAMINGNAIEAHFERGGKNIVIGLGCIGAVRGRFAKDANAKSVGEVGALQRQRPFEEAGPDSVTAIFDSCLLPVAGPAAPLRFSPIAGCAPKDETAGALLASARVTVGDEIMHKIFGNDSAIGGL